MLVGAHQHRGYLAAGACVATDQKASALQAVKHWCMHGAQAMQRRAHVLLRSSRRCWSSSRRRSKALSACAGGRSAGGPASAAPPATSTASSMPFALACHATAVQLRCTDSFRRRSGAVLCAHCWESIHPSHLCAVRARRHLCAAAFTRRPGTGADRALRLHASPERRALPRPLQQQRAAP